MGEDNTSDSICIWDLGRTKSTRLDTKSDRTLATFEVNEYMNIIILPIDWCDSNTSMNVCTPLSNICPDTRKKVLPEIPVIIKLCVRCINSIRNSIRVAPEREHMCIYRKSNRPTILNTVCILLAKSRTTDVTNHRLQRRTQHQQSSTLSRACNIRTGTTRWDA